MDGLNYKGNQWIWEGEREIIRLNDATYQRHLRSYLQRLGLPTQSYLQLLEQARQVSDQQYQASLQLRCDLNYWRQSQDPEVKITTLPLGLLRRYK